MSNWVVQNIGLGKGRRARKRMTKAGPILKSPGVADEGLEASPGQVALPLLECRYLGYFTNMFPLISTHSGGRGNRAQHLLLPAPPQPWAPGW